VPRPKDRISYRLGPSAGESFQARGVDVGVRPGLSPEDLAAISGDYEGLAIRSATKVTAALLEQASTLRVVGRAGIGVDNVDVPAATARGVVGMNTPFGNTITTAEHAIAMMFALARQLPAADRSTQAGKWEKSRFMGVELTGKTLGIIGMGNIGSIVADRARGLRMKVSAFDPSLSESRAPEVGVETVERDAWLAAVRGAGGERDEDRRGRRRAGRDRRRVDRPPDQVVEGQRRRGSQLQARGRTVRGGGSRRCGVRATCRPRTAPCAAGPSPGATNGRIAGTR